MSMIFGKDLAFYNESNEIIEDPQPGSEVKALCQIASDKTELRKFRISEIVPQVKTMKVSVSMNETLMLVFIPSKALVSDLSAENGWRHANELIPGESQIEINTVIQKKYNYDTNMKYTKVIEVKQDDDHVGLELVSVKGFQNLITRFYVTRVGPECKQKEDSSLEFVEEHGRKKIKIRQIPLKR